MRATVVHFPTGDVKLSPWSVGQIITFFFHYYFYYWYLLSVWLYGRNGAAYLGHASASSQPALSTSAASPWRGPGQRWALLRVPTRIPPLCLPAPAWGVRPVISTTADFDLDLPRKKASYTFGPLLGPPHQYNVQAQTETALGKLQSRTQTAV